MIDFKCPELWNPCAAGSTPVAHFARKTGAHPVLDRCEPYHALSTDGYHRASRTVSGLGSNPVGISPGRIAHRPFLLEPQGTATKLRPVVAAIYHVILMSLLLLEKALQKGSRASSR
jgi:hypothetical protein